jgi:hypothetical protein
MNYRSGEKSKKVHKKKSSSGDESRVHNKSGTNTLTVLKYTDEDLLKYLDVVKRSIYIDKRGLIEDSPCYIIKPVDGKLSYEGIKVTWAFHIVAFHKFGRRELEKVPSNKTQDDLLISHLCGSKSYCCNPDHLILETKRINDERTHCHYCIRNIIEKYGYNWVDIRDRVNLFFMIGSCNHNPKCCNINRTDVGSLFNFYVQDISYRSNVGTELIIISTTTNIDD